MNIFYLHEDPYTSAKAMTNKHVVKMILESAQMLSTAHHVLDKDQVRNKDKLYKPTHQNHPSSVWVRQSKEHYMWLYKHFIALSTEYTKRYDKTHLTYQRLASYLQEYPENLKNDTFTQPPQAMPDIYKDTDSVRAYRKYYLNEKIKEDTDLERFAITLWERGLI